MVSFLCVLLIAAAADSGETAPLEYRFNVGEELTYELVGKKDLLEDEEESERRYETKARWNVYPIRRNEDGSWRLIVRTWVKLLRYDREETDDGALGEWKAEPYVRIENTFLGYCDLRPDGSYQENPTLGHSYLFALTPELLFRPLPITGQGEESTTRFAPASNTTYTWKTRKETKNLVQLTGTLERPLSANYESTHKQVVEFDAAAGRIQQIVVTDKSERKDYPSHSRTTYRLVDVVEHSPDWTAKFEEAANAYFRDRNTWWDHKLQTNKMRTEAACRELVNNARKRLVEGKKEVIVDEVRSAYDGLIALHDREAEWDIEGAAERELLYSKPPVEWASTNLAGESRRRADYLGKVVILDFWYRGCGHCILALPKVKELHARYKDRGVVVLGVNNDRDLANAHHVVSTFSIPYESVRNEATPVAKTDGQPADDQDDSEELDYRISTEYGVNAWPTFVVLDQTGCIAEVVVGNAEDLVEHVSQVVDNLLATPPVE